MKSYEEMKKEHKILVHKIGSRKPSPSRKLTKAEVDYAYPAINYFCEDCVRFLHGPSGACYLVVGSVSPKGTCKYWKRR